VVGNGRAVAGQIWRPSQKTPATEQEVFEVLRRPRIAPKIAPFFFDNLRTRFAAAGLVTITERVAACRDPKDDMGRRDCLW
jgi:hypothetical protein